MTSWMRSEQMFDDHRALFTLTCKCGIGKSIFQYMRDATAPELAGCVVYFVRYDPMCHCWEIAVSHSSLPAVPLSCETKRFPLDKEQEAMEGAR